jgi:hypothetical protein
VDGRLDLPAIGRIDLGDGCDNVENIAEITQYVVSSSGCLDDANELSETRTLDLSTTA